MEKLFMLALLFDILSIVGIVFSYYLIRLLTSQIQELKEELRKRIDFEKNISANNDEASFVRLTNQIKESEDKIKNSLTELEDQIYTDLDIRRNQRKNY